MHSKDYQAFKHYSGDRKIKDIAKMDECEVIIDIAKELPTVEAKPVVHGEWVDTDFGTHCTACGRSYDPFEIKPREVRKFDFCPNCGADMRKKVE